MSAEVEERAARVQFDDALRARWPKSATTLVVEARPALEPWSVRLRITDAPDDSGTCLAWVSFLSDQAPIEPGKPVSLTLGPTPIGTLWLAQSTLARGSWVERDFLDATAPGPVREAA
jgi:hypothetical protein